MKLYNSDTHYGLVSYLFHWVMSLMVIALLFIGFNMEDAPQHLKASLYGGHKATGVLVLMLVICRLAWRFTSPPPALPNQTPCWQRFLSKVTIFFLYSSMLLMPISGISMNIFGGRSVNVFGLFTIDATTNKVPAIVELADSAHGIFALILASLVILHILGGLYHGLINRDNVLQRMLKPAK